MKLYFLVLEKYVLIMTFRENIILLIFLCSQNFKIHFMVWGICDITSSFFPIWLIHFFKISFFLEQGATWLIFCFYYVFRRTVGAPKYICQRAMQPC